jgi:hypothetical protein
MCYCFWFIRSEGSKGWLPVQGAGGGAQVHGGLLRPPGTLTCVVTFGLSGLRAVRGGYLCRVQEGELKYMAAFYDPQVCLLSCLVNS